MTPADAAKLLDLPIDATPEQLEVRFNELRQKLEDKIVKAPTPGLKAKYRESLDEITIAFETLTLAADSSSLPVIQKQGVGGPASLRAGSESDSGLRSQVSLPGDGPDKHRDGSSQQRRGLPARRKSGGKEFLLVASIAVLVLVVGGWVVMKTREDNEIKARFAELDKADKDRLAQLAKDQAERDRLAKEAAATAEKERVDRLFLSLRSRMAELNVGFDAALRSEQTAERDLNELKTQERDLKGADTLEARRLTAQVRAQDRYVRWLRDFLPAHPVRVAKARADELLSARAADDAGPAVTEYAAALEQIQADLVRERPGLAAVAAAVKAPVLPPAPKKLRPDGMQRNLSYLADRLYPYEQQELRDVRNHILNDDLTTVLFPKLEPYRSNLANLWPAVDGQIQQYAGTEAQLRSQISVRFANADELLRAIDGNQPLAANYVNDANIRALIMVRWQILNIREQVIQARYYFGVPNP